MDTNGRICVMFLLMGMMHNELQGMTWGAECNGTQSNNMKTLKVYTMPGMNGGGSGTGYTRSLFPAHELDITRIETHAESDLGQDKCMNALHNAMQQDTSTLDALVHASSQGTAALLNFIAHYGKDKRFKCLLLEGALISGNRAITHMLRGPQGEYGLIMDVPFSDHFVPYLAQCLRFPFYSPAGKQPIKSLEKIPKDLPVIIAHTKEDPKLSYDDACALYYGLKLHGNENVYLLPKSGSKHVHILEESDTPVIHAILKKHGLISGDTQAGDVDLSAYQPDHAQFASLYEDILAQEHSREVVEVSLYLAMAAAAGYAAVKSLMYLHKKLKGGK